MKKERWCVNLWFDTEEEASEAWHGIVEEEWPRGLTGVSLYHDVGGIEKLEE